MYVRIIKSTSLVILLVVAVLVKLLGTTSNLYPHSGKSKLNVLSRVSEPARFGGAPAPKIKQD